MHADLCDLPLAFAGQAQGSGAGKNSSEPCRRALPRPSHLQGVLILAQQWSDIVEELKVKGKRSKANG
jgi:hypothetical protein